MNRPITEFKTDQNLEVEALTYLRKAGLILVRLGLRTGDPRYRRAYNHIKKAVQILKGLDGEETE